MNTKTETAPSAHHSRSYSWAGRRRRMSVQSRHSTRSTRTTVDAHRPTTATSSSAGSSPSGSSVPSSPSPEDTASTGTFPVGSASTASHPSRPFKHVRQGSAFSTVSSSASSMVTTTSGASNDQANSFWHGSLRRFLKAISFRQDSLATRGDVGGTSGSREDETEEYTHHHHHPHSAGSEERLCPSCMQRNIPQHRPCQHAQQKKHALHHPLRRRQHKQPAAGVPHNNRCLSTPTGYCMGCGELLEHAGTYNGSHVALSLTGLPSSVPSLPSTTSRSRRNHEKRTAVGDAGAADLVDRWDRNQDPSYAGFHSIAMESSLPQPEANHNNHRQRLHGSKRRNSGRIGPISEDRSPHVQRHITQQRHLYRGVDSDDSYGTCSSTEKSRSRKSSSSSSVAGSLHKESVCSSTTGSNETVRQYFTGITGEYYYPIRNSKRLSMTAQEALQRRLAAVAATAASGNSSSSPGSFSTTAATPFIPMMDDISSRRGSSSSTGTQERVVYWTDIITAGDEDIEPSTVDENDNIDDNMDGEEGSSKRRQRGNGQRVYRRRCRPVSRRKSILSFAASVSGYPYASSPTTSLSSSAAGSSSSPYTPMGGSCSSLTLSVYAHENNASSAQYRRLSPVELPEILHLVFQSLINMTPPDEFSQRDLFQCLMVCKQWYIVAQKTLWREIRFRDPEQLAKFIDFLQSNLPPRMPAAAQEEGESDNVQRIPGAWCVKSVEQLGIENSQLYRPSEDIRMRMDGFDDQDEENAMEIDGENEDEHNYEGADVVMSQEYYPSSLVQNISTVATTDLDISFTSQLAVQKRIQDRSSAVKKIVLHKFKTLTDAEVLPLTTWFPNLISIEFYICELLTDQVVVSLAEHCPRLQYLLLPGCAKVTDEGIKAVARHCPRLRHLDLRACSLVSDNSLIEIAERCPKLWHLNCGRVTGAYRVTGRSIVPIASNTNLNTLGLAGCGMTDDAVIKVAEFCREGLNRISLNCCSELTSASIRALMVHCPNLAVLEIKKCLKIFDMAPLNHFVRQRILVELCPDLQKRLVAFKVELASQQAAAAAAATASNGASSTSAVARTTAASQESNDAGQESQHYHSGVNRQGGAHPPPSASSSSTSGGPRPTLLTTTTTITTTTTETETETITTTTTATTATTTIVSTYP